MIVPKPVMDTLVGVPGTLPVLLVMVKVAFWAAPEVGVKVTSKVPVAPAATESDVVLGTNCPSFETILVIVSVEPPVLEIVTVITEATPTGTLP